MYRVCAAGPRSAQSRRPVLCVSGAADRMISRRISAAVVARYEAEHIVLEGRGHWLIAPTGAEKAATPVLDWLARTLTASVAPVALAASESVNVIIGSSGHLVIDSVNTSIHLNDQMTQ